MSKIEISHLIIYPIKSTKGIIVEECFVNKIGIQYDRNFAIIDANHKIITARENPRLLKIGSKINEYALELSASDKHCIELRWDEMDDHISTEVTIFNDQVIAKIVNNKLNEWISDVIQEPSRLITIDKDALRRIKEKHNGKEQDYIAFTDASPIHLISEESVNSLNDQLETPVTIHNFRPNIVVKGCEAYEEDTWNYVKIGDCVFESIVKTERCNLITIDPLKVETNRNQEPLRTLSKIRKENNKVLFGIYLIPVKAGLISKHDIMEVL